MKEYKEISLSKAGAKALMGGWNDTMPGKKRRVNDNGTKKKTGRDLKTTRK